MTSPAEGTSGVNTGADAAPLCARCGEHPRVPKQRWCRACRAAWKRDRRRQTRQASVPAETQGNSQGDHGRERVLSDAATQALEAYHIAVCEYEEARRRDWRRQRVSPATVLHPLWQRVVEARRWCLALGLDPEGNTGR